MFRKFFIPLLGFIAGTVTTYLAVVIGTTFLWDILNVHDRDGGGTMGLAFVIGPFIALFGGIAGGVWAYRLIGRR